MCANETCSSVLSVSAPTLISRKRSQLVTMAVALVEAFQEALDMRQAARRRFLLSDE